MSDKKNELVS